MTDYEQTLRKFWRVWRAIVEPLKHHDPERVVFIEAFSREEARRKLRAAIAAIDGCDLDAVEYYNLEGIRDLLDNNFSADFEKRLFETGGGTRNGVPYETYCEHPLFLTRDPHDLFGAWLKCLPDIASHKSN